MPQAQILCAQSVLMITEKGSFVQDAIERRNQCLDPSVTPVFLKYRRHNKC